MTAKIVFVELRSTRLAEDKAFYSAAFGMAVTDFGPTYACTMTGAGDIGWQAVERAEGRAGRGRRPDPIRRRHQKSRAPRPR